MKVLPPKWGFCDTRAISKVRGRAKSVKAVLLLVVSDQCPSLWLWKYWSPKWGYCWTAKISNPVLQAWVVVFASHLSCVHTVSVVVCCWRLRFNGQVWLGAALSTRSNRGGQVFMFWGLGEPQFLLEASGFLNGSQSWSLTSTRKELTFSPH